MSNPDQQRFSSRLGLILSALGIAVGTGNIWRFPRIAAQNGGEQGAGAFIVAWVVFLFLWSIPLIIAEYGIGRNGRKGPIESFTKLMGEKWAWKGAFVGFVATFIMFYYSVVTGWCMYYLGSAISGNLATSSVESLTYWNSFQSGNWPVILHFLAIFGAGMVVIKGVKTIEIVNKILIPSLLIVLVYAFFRAVTMDGSAAGLSYLFTFDAAQLTDPGLWLEALTQNAWDTGAGWGLILCYSAYVRENDAINKSAIQTGLGNNLVSMMAAMIIFSTVFATLGKEMSTPGILEVMKTSGPASTGLTFIWIPQLFNTLEGGKLLTILFFGGLVMAAFSSLISMMEMASRMLVDRGIPRSNAVWLVVVVGFLLGVPSAVNINFFANQDFVWGVALMISGAMIANVIIGFGSDKFLAEKINVVKGDIVIGQWWSIVLKYLIPVQVVVLLSWWIWLSVSEFSPDRWFDPFDPYSLMTCLVQWGLLGILLRGFNGKLVKPKSI